MYKYFKKLNLALNMSSTGLIVIGTIVGSVTLNRAVLGAISGSGLVLNTFAEIKDYKRKIEMSKYAFTTYQKVLLDLRTYLRGAEFNKNDFIRQLNLIDDTIVDFAPPITRFEKKYNIKTFTSKSYRGFPAYDFLLIISFLINP